MQGRALAEVDSALRQVQQQNPSRSRQDVVNALLPNPYLQCQVSADPSFRGMSPVPCLCIKGMITTRFRQQDYQTPISVFVSRQYPSAPPIVVLNPENNMVVDPRCDSIDSSGRVIHPCVNTEWNPARSTIVEALTIIASAFGDGGTPPLRALGPGAAPQPRGPPNYGYPGTVGMPSGYPPPTYAAPYIPPSSQGGRAGGGVTQPHGQSAQYGYMPQSGAAPGYPPVSSYAASPPSAQYAGQGPRPAQGQGQGGMQRSAADVRDDLQAGATRALQSSLQQKYGQLLQAATETRALTDTLKVRKEMSSAALQGLRDRDGELQEYIAHVKGRIEAAKAWLAEQERRGIGGGGGSGARAVRDGERDRSYTRDGVGDGDDAASLSSSARHSGPTGGGRPGLGFSDMQEQECLVVPTSVLGRQLMRTVAEDVALDDYLPHVDEALAAHNIRPEELLLEVREVARRQFQARALGKKIDEALGAAARSTAELHRQYAWQMQMQQQQGLLAQTQYPPLGAGRQPVQGAPGGARKTAN